MLIQLIVGLIKKISLYKMSYFLEPYAHRKKIKFRLELSNYATKSDLKRATYVDISDLAKNVDLARLKPDVEKLDIW